MCGIVGYVGGRRVQEILLAGLEKLEYRGYDSAGISVLADGRLESVRAVGNLSRLRAAHRRGAEGGGVAVATRPATTGIGHTRWATHGRVTEENAHPHFDTEDRVHVVVNGIVENYLELKQELRRRRRRLHVRDRRRGHRPPDLARARRRRPGRGRAPGLHAPARPLRVRRRRRPTSRDVLVAARKECPLVVGRGDGEQFIASAIPRSSRTRAASS